MHELYVFCVSEHLMCDIDCDIEVIQQEVEVKTAPPLKKWTQGKVLRRVRKRLLRFSERREIQRQKSSKSTKTKWKTKKSDDSQEDAGEEIVLRLHPPFSFHTSHAIKRNFLCGFKKNKILLSI